jgi:hypothetical protein
MRRSTLRHWLATPACLLLAAAMLVGCEGSDSGNVRATDPATGGAAGRTTYFAQYGVSGHAYKPRRLNPSVDGSLYVGGMQWTAWDDRSAVGHGTAHVNDCTPDCADGHYASHRVTVRLSRPRELCGSRFFTAIRVQGPGYHTAGHWKGVACR